MNQFDVVNYYDLQVGDQIIRKKGPLSRHYGIYAGFHSGLPLVAENQPQNGVQYVTLQDFLLNDLELLMHIDKFAGTEEERQQVVRRINEKVGTKYDLLNFNCEHFASWVQTGRPESKQVGTAVVSLGLLALGVWAFSKG